MGMTKAAAQAVAASLKGCPFCGYPLTATILGTGDWAPNPRANCATDGCWGGKLPTLALDRPKQVAAYNTRWTSRWPPDMLTCAECGVPEIGWCSCADSPMNHHPGTPERAAAIAAVRAAAKQKGRP